MAKFRYRLAVLAVSIAALGAIAAPAAQAVVLPITNWHVGGSLGVKKLNQSIQLPSGSRFTGALDIAPNGQGTITGHTTIPEFTTTVKLLGLLPSQVTLLITETAPTAGTIQVNGADGTATTDVTVSSDLRIKKLGAAGLSIPPGANCHSSTPVLLHLHNVGLFDLFSGFAFNGTYTIPRFTGCGLLTPTLNLLMAGPNNPFSVTIKPPSAG